MLFSCNCSTASFCAIANSIEEGIVFKGETILVKEHVNGYHSAIIKILNKIKGEEILTDTIELFGGINQAGCEINLGLNIGDINYFALIDTDISTIDMDQFELENENYWVMDTHACFYKKLTIEGGFVTGCINDEFDKYPLEFFERDLVGCSFSTVELQKHLCPNFSVYPNPAIDNIFLGKTENSVLIDELKIYSVAGELLVNANRDQISSGNILLPHFEDKLVILELMCGEERILEKIFVLK